MQVKVFEAQDMRSALEKVKKVLGPDALILSTRSVAKGRLGLGGRGGIEVTAAVDTDLAGTGSQQQATAKRRPAEKKDFQAYLNHQGPAAARKEPEAAEDGDLFEELRQMRRSFQDLARQFSRENDRPGAKPAANAAGSPAADHGYLGGHLFPDLSEFGIGTEASRLFSGMWDETGPADASEDSKDLSARLERFIADTLEMENPLSDAGGGQRRMVFIGPTGVGKTTTIAKVAARCMLDYGKKIALATIDNYRIAAVEQLKIYGQIMDVPVEVARGPEQLEEIFSRHTDKDMILVDTAGRSPKDEARQQELALFLDPSFQTENHLVLSATTRERDLHAIIDRFRHFDLHGLVMTKLDECDVLGQILNVGLQASCPLRFLTNGQKVPEDLLLPEPRVLTRMILNPDEVVATWNIKETATRPEHCAN